MTALCAFSSTVARIQSLARPSDPIQEVGFVLFESTQQERIRTHALSSLAARLGVREQVELEKIYVDPKLRWFQIGNVWHNASLRSVKYTVATQATRLAG